MKEFVKQKFHTFNTLFDPPKFLLNYTILLEENFEQNRDDTAIVIEFDKENQFIVLTSLNAADGEKFDLMFYLIDIVLSKDGFFEEGKFALCCTIAWFESDFSGSNELI